MNGKTMKEIVNLSTERLNFDIDMIDAEELERRVELAIQQMMLQFDYGDCPIHCECFTVCPFDCATDRSPLPP